MAITLGLRSTTAAPVSPAFDPAWDDVSIGARLFMNTASLNTTFEDAAFAPDASTANLDILGRQWVGPPMGAQTILAQTIKLQIRAMEGGKNGNMFLAWSLRICSRNGSTIRGTLVALQRDGTEMDEKKVENRGDSATSTELVILNGDRLVLEVGAGGTPSGASDHEYLIRIGSSTTAGNLPEDDIDQTEKNPWLFLTNTPTAATADPQGTRFQVNQSVSRGATF